MSEKILKATHNGELHIGGKVIPVAVLDDGTRVITQRGVFVALGMNKNPSKGQASIDNQPAFISANNLNPFISEELRRSWTPIQFRLAKGSGGYKGNIAFGYDAKILPLVCEAYLDAAEAGKLAKNQEHIAVAAKIIYRGFAIVGITALIDEATGYQEIRDKRALQEILDKYLLKELAAWAKRFPDEFYRQIFRLRGWQWKGMKVNRPSVVGHYTNDLVYERLAPGILEELKKRMPLTESGNRKGKLTQLLTDEVGHPALQAHLQGIMALQRAAPDAGWSQFHRMVERAYPKFNETPPFNLGDE